MPRIELKMKSLLSFVSIVILVACSETQRYVDVQYAVLTNETVTREEAGRVEVIGSDVFIYRTGLRDSIDQEIIDMLRIEQGNITYAGLDWKHLQDLYLKQFPDVTFQLFESHCAFDCHQRLIVAEGMGFIGRHDLYSTMTELMTSFDGVEFEPMTKSELRKVLEFRNREE